MKMDCRLYSTSSLCDELFHDIENREEINVVMVFEDGVDQYGILFYEQA